MHLVNGGKGEHTNWDKELKFLIFVAVPTQVFCCSKIPEIAVGNRNYQESLLKLQCSREDSGQWYQLWKNSTVKGDFEANFVSYMCIF